MNILFIDPNNSTAQVNYPLIEELKKIGIKIQYFSSYNRWDSQYYESNYNVNCRYFYFILANKIKNQKIRQIVKGLSYPINQLFLLFIILFSKVQIIHFNNITIPLIDFLFIAIIKFSGRKVIITVHNYIRHNKISDSKISRTIFSMIDCIICLSEFTFNQFPEKILDKVTLIEHGNCYEKELNKFMDPDLTPKKKPLRLLFLGIIRPYKGIENLLKAFSYLSEKTKEKLEIHIVGNVLNKNYLKKLLLLRDESRHKEQLIIKNKFLDYREMIQHIQQCHFGILPYVSATQSGIPYLFISLKKPLIVTNVGALPEQIHPYIAEITLPNPEYIAKSIERMIKRIEQNEVEEIVFEELAQKYSWKNIVSKYVETYQKLI